MRTNNSTKTSTIIDGFRCPAASAGGLWINLEKITSESWNYLSLRAIWAELGVPGPAAVISLLSLAQIDAMIRLLEKAKANFIEIKAFNEYLGEPEFYSDKNMEDVLK